VEAKAQSIDGENGGGWQAPSRGQLPATHNVFSKVMSEDRGKIDVDSGRRFRSRSTSWSEVIVLFSNASVFRKTDAAGWVADRVKVICRHGVSNRGCSMGGRWHKPVEGAARRALPKSELFWMFFVVTVAGREYIESRTLDLQPEFSQRTFTLQRDDGCTRRPNIGTRGK